MNKKKLLLFILVPLLVGNNISFGQNSFGEMKDKKLKDFLEYGYVGANQIISKSFNGDSKKSIKFNFGYSRIELNGDFLNPIFYFSMADTSKYEINKIAEVRYEFNYTYKNIEMTFSIINDSEKNIKFNLKSDSRILSVLSEIEKDSCQKCFKSLELFIAKKKIKKYKLSIEITDENYNEIYKKFNWKLIVEKPINGETWFYVNPETGKEISQKGKFIAPKIRRN